jgi:hypothetical protein
MKKLKDNIRIEIYQHDWMPGFAAFQVNSLKKGAKAHVALNIGGLLGIVRDKSIKEKELPYVVAECLMHEIIHVLEEWAGTEFSHEKIENLITKYQEHYHSQRSNHNQGKK